MFLAAEDPHQSIGFSCHLFPSLVCRIVPKVCRALCRKLQPIHMEMPGDANNWWLIDVNYENVWYFPHCVGAMDGEHVLIRAPDNSSTHFFNYRGDILSSSAGYNQRCIQVHLRRRWLIWQNHRRGNLHEEPYDGTIYLYFRSGQRISTEGKPFSLTSCWPSTVHTCF